MKRVPRVQPEGSCGRNPCPERSRTGYGGTDIPLHPWHPFSTTL